MKPVAVFAIFSLVISLVLSKYEDNVLVLDDANFEEETAKYDVLLIEFYAPWCGHCKRLEPEYKKAAEILANHDLTIAKIDCPANSETCNKHGVSGYPTLKLFRKGKFSSEYDSGRDTDSIVKYMKKKSGPSSKLLKDVEAVEKFTANIDPVVVGFFEKEDNDLHKEFINLANTNEDFSYAHTTNPDVLKKYKYSNKVVIFRPENMKNKFEDDRVVYESGDMNEWLRQNVYGLAGHMTMQNDGYFKQPLVTVYYNVDFVRNKKGTQYWRNRVMKVAKKFTDEKLNFAIASRGEFSQQMSEFGLSGDTSEDTPSVTIKSAKGEKFAMKDKFSMDTFEKFLKQYVGGELEAYLKSEPRPEDNDGPVKVVVAKNFQEIVNDEDKDVLIEFYAPWCGHCKNLEPKYNELGEKLKDEPNVVIAKMDATANDVPSPYEVQGFPTIYFSPRGDKNNPKKYQGGREVKDFMKYLKTNAKLTTVDKKGKKKDKEEL